MKLDLILPLTIVLFTDRAFYDFLPFDLSLPAQTDGYRASSGTGGSGRNTVAGEKRQFAFDRRKMQPCNNLAHFSRQVFALIDFHGFGYSSLIDQNLICHFFLHPTFLLG